MSEEVTEGANGSEDRSDAYQEAAVELAKGIALGAVPFLGQAIDAYDTIESSIVLCNAESTGGKEDAQFDLLMAIIGWIPGPGDGLKKSLRIVNKDPQRYAPVLFDLLRFVLQECGIKTSPEELLKQVFNAGKLTAELDEIITGVKGSSTFQSLPNWAKTSVVTVLAASRDNMPAIVGIVEKRLVKWKGMQRNSSGAATGSSKPAHVKKPAAKDSTVATQGNDGASGTASEKSDRTKIGISSIHDITNEGLGVSGEHIADYMCAEKLGWGKNWDSHDNGIVGKWLKGRPNAETLGKISKGGSSKLWNVLYKLTDAPNGTGIDAVWRASTETNGHKKFAIVEAKASRHEDAPKFMRKKGNTRKPSIVSKLGINGPDASTLLEPIEDETANSGKKSGTSMKSGKRTTHPTQSKPKPTVSGKVVIVQMSTEWISKNIRKAVPDNLVDDVLFSYSRHLFYTPLYLASAEQHARARFESSDESTHAEHNAIHYEESAVKAAVNKRKRSLMQKHGTLDSLKVEA
ncbi:hypothetical protein [Pseudomonas viridiflava]|uniref:hypothetical protein n=1 Tax=Pseudomonas viridiflava TaxID=33069 RepID=UPI0013CE61CB|nr:hypothetical protein [Pseudomonas viridiflava]